MSEQQLPHPRRRQYCRGALESVVYPLVKRARGAKRSQPPVPPVEVNLLLLSFTAFSRAWERRWSSMTGRGQE